MEEILLYIEILIEKNYPELSDEEVKLKAKRWVELPNMNFGNVSPRTLAEKGRVDKVILWLERVIAGDMS
jgi:hypothetical protein